MLYFAYGSDLPWSHLAAFAAQTHAVLPIRSRPIAATLGGHYLHFPVYDPRFSGGAADIHPSPGKSVTGTLLRLPDSLTPLLDRFHHADDGLRRRVEITVQPYGRPPVTAVTYRVVRPDTRAIAPAPDYLRALMDAAYADGHSEGWLHHLRSFEPPQRAATPALPTIPSLPARPRRAARLHLQSA